MTQSGVQTSIGINVSQQSTIYVSNEVVKTFIIIPGLRGLDSREITSNLEPTSRGFQTWTATGDLKVAHLEIFDPRTDEAVERWDMIFNYEANGGQKSQFKTEMDKLKDFASKLGKLRPGCRYRIVVELEDGAPPVEGWTPTTLRDVTHLGKRSLGGYIDTPRINIGMEFWGET